MNELSANSLANASALSNIDGLTLQMVNIRIMNSDQKTVRYLFSLSDGSNTIRALTSMPFVEKIESGEIRKNTIVHIISSRKVRDSAFYVTDMTVVKQMDYVIGNPLGGSSNQQPQQQQPSAYQQPAVRPPVQQQAPAYQQPQPSYQQPQPSYQQPQPSYQQPQPSYQQPQPSYQPYQQQSSYQQNPSSTGMPLKNGPAGGNYQVDTTRFNQIPISAIHPYLDKNWFIRCRVTSKSSVRTFNSQRGEGKLFNADLLDSEGSEIRIAFFSECVDLFYEYLQQGKVYDFCNMKVSFANRRYNPLKNEYELAANRFTQIQEVGDDRAIQSQHYDFVSIADVAKIEPKKAVDILAIVESHEPMSEFRSRKGNEMKRKQLTIVDSSNNSINFTIFGDNAMITDDRLAGHPVIAIKNAVVSDFGGHSLSGFDSTSFSLNPDLPQAVTLRQWYASQGGQTSVSLSVPIQPTAADPLKRKTLSVIADEHLGFGEKPDFITVKAMVRNIPHERAVFYPSCASPVGADGKKCQKKVTQGPDGMWVCESCGQRFAAPSYRYILNLEIMDHTGSAYVSMFNDDAETLLGMRAEQLNELLLSNKDESDNVFKRALFKEYVFTLRVKAETSSNFEGRVRSSVQRFHPVDQSQEVENMITIIENLCL